mgnify:CR=1 FL=1
MKIGLQTWGTDGDFFPFLALAQGLKDAGHQVTIAYTSIDRRDYSDWEKATGIQLIKADGGMPAPQNSNPYDIDAKPGSFKEYSTLLRMCFNPYSEAMYTASKKLCQENDLVIGHPVCHTLLTASQKYNVPRISLVLTPIIVKSNYFSPIGIEFGRWGNSFLWSIGGKFSTSIWFKEAKKIRKREGLPSVKSLQKELFTSDLLTIVASSEALCSRPQDWPKSVQITGFLNLSSKNESWQMPEDLKHFLNNGEPPVYMTFGSCIQFDLDNSTALMVEAARLSGKRTIIQSDWNEQTKPNEPNIFCIDRVPHSEIFPHCSLIVHHGGAGTTQAALLAGKPSVVVAHGFDQVYWGNQLQSSGVSGTTLTKLGVKPEQLAGEINKVLNSKLNNAKASLLSQKMKNESGVQKAVSIIESLEIKSV